MPGAAAEGHLAGDEDQAPQRRGLQGDRQAREILRMFISTLRWVYIICTYIHIYIYIYTYVYTYIYIYMYI